MDEELDDILHDLDLGSPSMQSKEATKAQLKRRKKKQDRKEQEKEEVALVAGDAKVKVNVKAKAKPSAQNKERNFVKRQVERQREQKQKKEEKARQLEQLKRQHEEEEEGRRIEQEKQVQEQRERKQKEKAEKREKQKREGTWITKKARRKLRQNQEKVRQMQVQQESKENKFLLPAVSSPTMTLTQTLTQTPARPSGSIVMRAPICCVLAHSNHGKTSLLDAMRHSHVQEKEAGGITQQIGATFFPIDVIQQAAAKLFKENKFECKLPGLLILDTPGHDTFLNLRARGAQLCDLAILVIDILQGIQRQTIESRQLLKEHKTPFVVALTKMDKLYGWKSSSSSSSSSKNIEEVLSLQTLDVKSEFKRRTDHIITGLAIEGMNSALYYENEDKRKYVSLVPTSAVTAEGLPDLYYILLHLTQRLMFKSLRLSADNDNSDDQPKDQLDQLDDRLEDQNFKCVVMEMRVLEGLGHTLDVILVNGTLHEGDTIVLGGTNGSIVTTIRALLTPPPLHEMRVKSDYVRQKEVTAAIGVKLVAPNLEHAIPGMELHICGCDNEQKREKLKKKVERDCMTSQLTSQLLPRDPEGVYVQASSVGSLEALLILLKTELIPVSGVGIGAVHRHDVIKAASMVERRPEYAVILAFDVRVDPEARTLAEEFKVKIFHGAIVYHLATLMHKHLDEITETKKNLGRNEAVFPCIMEILPKHIIHLKNPIILGVRVKEGILKLGTSLCSTVSNVSATSSVLRIGKVENIQKDHKDVSIARPGDEIAIKINHDDDPHLSYGRQFDSSQPLYSHLTRPSIDALKLCFKDEMDTEKWKLVVKLKKILQVV